MMFELCGASFGHIFKKIPSTTVLSFRPNCGNLSRLHLESEVYGEYTKTSLNPKILDRKAIAWGIWEVQV